MIYYGHIENGKYSGQKPDLSKFKGRVSIEVLSMKPTRSNLQNRYYWGVVLKYIADEIGHTVEEVHEIMKQMFLEPKTVRLNHASYIIPVSTTTLNKEQFMIYLDNIRDWASQFLNVYIPSPNEFYGE